MNDDLYERAAKNWDAVNAEIFKDLVCKVYNIPYEVLFGGEKNVERSKEGPQDSDRGERSMTTNRDRVNGLTDEQLAILIVHYMPKIGGRWTESVFGIKEWLSDIALEEEWADIRFHVFGEQ